MALHIHISGAPTGTGTLFLDREKAKQISVPTYRTTVTRDHGDEHTFEVTRDTARTIKPQSDDPYVRYGECPPNKPGRPYHARVRTDRPRGFRLELYEPSLCKERSNNALRGVGDTLRESIQIHIGPAYSEGCFCLKGGRDELERLQRLVPQEDKENQHIEVIVADRHSTSPGVVIDSL